MKPKSCAVGMRNAILRNYLKAGTHERACSRSALLQHVPGAKLPCLHQRFLAKKYVAQQNFCSRVLLPHIQLVWYKEQAPGANLLQESVSRASSFVCTEICLPWHAVSPDNQSNWPSFFIHNSALRTPIGLFHIQLPRRVLRVYWLGYVFRVRVSGTSSLVCTVWMSAEYFRPFFLAKWKLLSYIYRRRGHMQQQQTKQKTFMSP